MRVRVARATVMVVLLLAFVGDLRVLAPVLAAVLMLAAWRAVVPRREALAGAGLLAAATVAFETDREVTAWALVLAVAVAAGVAATIASGRPAAARPGAGSTSRAA